MIAYILANIGTPKSPTTKDVGPYLTEFLTDPDVIPLPYIFRQILVRGLIVPRRAPASAAKYALIWTPEGSPLLVNAKILQAELSKSLDGPVLLGMQYGEPSMENAFREAIEKGATSIQLVPLYPQYAEATTGSATKRAKLLAKKYGVKDLKIFPPFPVADYFVNAIAAKIRARRTNNQHVLFTFHGLPENQVKKGAPGCLVENNCCEREPTPHCYRAQSFASAKALARTLGLEPKDWSVSFQSRLGRAKWISPYTEDVLRAMPARGIDKVLVVSPSFISDCLETLEELGVEGQNTFLSAGGREYQLVPCVNGDAEFAAGLSQALRDESQRSATSKELANGNIGYRQSCGEI